MANPTDHYLLTGLDVHSTIWKTVADAAALAALTPAAEDIGKDVLQADDSSVHKLVETGPAVWKNITAAGSPSTRSHSFQFHGNVKADGAINTWYGQGATMPYWTAQQTTNYSNGAQPGVAAHWSLQVAPFDGVIEDIALLYAAGTSNTAVGDFRFVKVVYTLGTTTTTESTIGTDISLPGSETFGAKYDVSTTFSSNNAISKGDGIGLFYRNTDATGATYLYYSAHATLRET